MRNVPWRKWRNRRKAERVATDDLVAATDRLNLDVTLDPQRSYAGVGAASDVSQEASASATTLVESAGNERTAVTALQPDDIRVLDIDSARSDNDTMIQCRRRVLHIPRDTIPDDVAAPWLVQPLLRESYITLSYAWGETKEDGSHLTETIRCDGALLRITSNLHGALLRIRNMMHVERRISIEPVWIDALCIEQDDIEERNVQVQNMGHVYQSSSQVIVWLGETDNETNPGLPAFVHKLDSVCAAYGQHELNQDHAERQRLLGHKSPFTKHDNHCMVRLLDRPWFSRRWVIQEAYHKAPYHRLMCIDKTLITGDRFERALLDLQCVVHAPALERAEQQQKSLLQNLQLYGRARCSDPRDYIYALVSISMERKSMAVDYGISAEELYLSFARNNYTDIFQDFR
ncbi:hypothetical protein LTR49_020432 [Elasticomyces elasticus]|nr:hypothetical protein LTR49_020432 [Elasticomyces elasticus]KAK5759991.1 hypothetical protein LTS12_009887 [Elasticomyces elasticus]